MPILTGVVSYLPHALWSAFDRSLMTFVCMDKQPTSIGSTTWSRACLTCTTANSAIKVQYRSRTRLSLVFRPDNDSSIEVSRNPPILVPLFLTFWGFFFFWVLEQLFSIVEIISAESSEATFKFWLYLLWVQVKKVLRTCLTKLDGIIGFWQQMAIVIIF